MTTEEGKVQGAIGYLRQHQPHNINAMLVCDAYEALRQELKEKIEELSYEILEVWELHDD